MDLKKISISRLNRPNIVSRRSIRDKPCIEGKPKVGITMGDPSGIGPEVIIKTLASCKIKGLANFLVIGDLYVFEYILNRLDFDLPINKLVSSDKLNLGGKIINFLNMNNVPKKSFQVGKISRIYGKASIEYIEMTVELLKKRLIDVMVTAPINKEAINMAGYKFGGHTEYLAYLTDTKDPVMMLVGGPLKVSLVTRHLALKEVSREITIEKIYRAIKLTYQALMDYFDIGCPKVGVCSLNPHSANGGIFGKEEKDLIEPAILKAKKEVLNLFGPIPSDSLFHDAYLGLYDAVIAMYHDQGLIPLKMVAKDCGVNITLGLPFIRTSPDHGTGFDIAGKGVANPQSMIEAIKLAVRMWKKQQQINPVRPSGDC